jgi:hypothetical protein
MRREVSAILVLLVTASTTAAAESEWVHIGRDGKLTYKTSERGDQIMDFSAAGYGGGGVNLPDVPVVKTLSPSGDDDSRVIQEAIDEVSKRPLDGRFRGAVLLGSGVYGCQKSITIKASGVVLRGGNGAILRLTGNHAAISVGTKESPKPAGAWVAMTDDYVPSGSTTFRVREVSGFTPGDPILIRRPATAAWVQFMGMDKLVRNGRKETWVSGSILTERTIRSIEGKQLTLEIPLSDSFDARYLVPPGGAVAKFTDWRMSNIGIEHLRIESPPQPVTISEPHNSGISLSGVVDAWVRDVRMVDTVGSVSIGTSARRITIQNVDVTHTVPTRGSAKPADFDAGGTQILFDRCSGTGDDLFYFVTGARATGPIVLLNCTFHGHGWIQPHQRWATGLLLDNCQVPEGGIDFMNRGEMGSGHGWTVGWAVAWNCEAKSFTIQQPPGAMNWAIGCSGARAKAAMPFTKSPTLAEGTYDSFGQRVSPQSLYLAQLKQRLSGTAS